MNVSLNSHFDDFISEKVKSGKYNSASEVIRAALRLLEERENEYKAQIDFYRGKINEGIESGDVSDWDFDNFILSAEKKAGLKE